MSKLEVKRVEALIAMGNDKFEVDDQLAGALLALLADLTVSDQAELLCYILCEYGGRNVKPTSYPCEITRIGLEEHKMAESFLKPIYVELESAFFSKRLSCLDFSRLIIETLDTLSSEAGKRIFLAMVLSSHFTPFNYRKVEWAINEKVAGKIFEANREEVTALVDIFLGKGQRFYSHHEQAVFFMDHLFSASNDVISITLSILLQKMEERNGIQVFTISKEVAEALVGGSNNMGAANGLKPYGAKSKIDSLH